MDPKIVVGVPLISLLERKEESYKIRDHVIGSDGTIQPALDEHGEPVYKVVTREITLILGKKVTSAEKVRNVLGSHGLQFVIGGQIDFEASIAGIIVATWQNNETSLSHIQEVYQEVKNIFESLGVHKEPKVYLVVSLMEE